MKLLFTTFFSVMLLLSFSKQDELLAVEATYDGQAGGVFYFVDMEGSSFTFDDIEPEILEKYDFSDGSFEGRRFTVIYRIVYDIEKDKEQEDGKELEEGKEQEEIIEQEENEEEEYNYGECIIVELELIG